MTPLKPDKTDGLLKRGLLLEYATLGWNVVGVAITALASIKAHSVGLAGFGFDSLIEIFASLIVAWQITDARKDRGRRALKLIGLAFGLLAFYLVAQIAISFAADIRPRPSQLGITWLAITFVVMCALARGKRVTGRKLGNAVLIAESGVTFVDACLAGAVLLGLGLNALLGWWWADPISGVFVLVYAVKEGLAAWRHGTAETA